MSYPPPPPPGQGDPTGQGGQDPYSSGQNPYQGGPGAYQPNPYGGAPYGQPPKKDNTLWWILGVIGVVVVICCIGVCGFFGWVGTEAADEIDSISSSSSGAQASSATEISEGSQKTDNGATVRAGWSVTSTDDLSGISLRNDGTSRDMLRVKFFFMEDGDVLGTATCSSSFLEPGETDFSPSCTNPVRSIDGYDEIRFSEGY